MAWRMTSIHEFKTGSYESTECKDDGLKELIGSKLVKIQYNTPTDLIFFFDNGYQIETFKHSSENGLMELFSFEQGEKEPTVIQMEASGDWSVAEDISFTKDEKEFYKHSEDTDSRWELLLPADDSDTPCSKCAYYLPVRGQFHFWNYGLCSNQDSVYDGRAVSDNCSCAYFCLSNVVFTFTYRSDRTVSKILFNFMLNIRKSFVISKLTSLYSTNRLHSL
jgi:hypothetical protein